MNIVDVIVGALLMYALWKGWSSGVLVQLGGIAGVVIGAWLAFRFSEKSCVWFDLDPDYKWLMFVAILIVAMIGVILLSRLTTKLLEMGGLSFPIRLLGSFVSVLKVIIILALIMRTFENINNKAELTDSTYIKESYSYQPLDTVATTIFPYLTSWLADTEVDSSELEKQIEEKIDKEIDKQIEKKLENLQKTNI